MAGDNDLVDRPEDLQNLDQSTGKLTMTLSKCLLILVVANLVLGLIVWLAASAFKIDLLMAGLAWGCCSVATILGHLFSRFPKGEDFLLLRLAAGMSMRTLIPMGFLVWGYKIREPQAQPSIIWITMLVYLVGLALDSYLSLVRSQAGEQL
ncbi:hypothetical protein N9Y42_04280 [Mariniblastus sp.]|nr:hypothetical protein [Mariniblastus sp.]